MLFLLIALLIGIIGAGPVFISDIDKKYKVKVFLILAGAYTLLGWWIFWGSLFSTAWPVLGHYATFLLLWWIISAVVAGIASNEPTRAIWFPVGLFAIIMMFCFFGSAMLWNSKEYSSLIGKFDTKNQVHWSKDIQPLDQKHLRLVPDTAAIHSAMTSLTEDGNSLGSQFPLSTEYITLQKIKEDYYYLIPLDFKSWRVWTSTESVPGYVKVSATDPNAKPILVTHKSMKYTPNAYWWDNLERRLYGKYHNKVLRDCSFEENDNGDVFWVITVCSPTITYWGLVIEGVIIFNPENAEEKFVSKDELNSNPEYKWVDRMMFGDLAKAYVDYWGKLKGGWINSVWSHLNILESESPTMNYSADGRCVFVIPVTSSNNDDRSMSGLMYCDAKTGEFTYYTTTGGCTEEDILVAVNDVVKFRGWHPSQQVVYDNVYGHLAALVPVIGKDGTYQGLGIVKTDTRKVAFGLTPQAALIEFQKLIMNVGGQISTENAHNTLNFKGKISRIGWEMSGTDKQYYVFFPEFKNSFMVSSMVQSELSLTEKGDLVEIKYLDSEQAAVPTTFFKNLTLDLRVSANEASVNKQMQQRKDSSEMKVDVKDFKENLKTMSDSEIKKLMELKK